MILSYRSLVHENLSKLQLENALFWADKAYNNSGDMEDLYWFAYLLICTDQCKRAINLINNPDLKFNCRKFKDALEILENDNYDKSFSLSFSCHQTNSIDYSLVLLLFGKIFQELHCYDMAKKHFLLALYHDCTNYEAMSILVKNSYLKQYEDQNIFHDEQSDQKVKNLKMMFQVSNFEGCYNSLKTLPKQNLLEPEIITINISCLCQLSKTEVYLKRSDIKIAGYLNLDIIPFYVMATSHYIRFRDVLSKHIVDSELYELTHHIMESHPNSAVSWYAVSCYNLLLEKIVLCRMYLNKVLAIDKFFAPAWILLGHTYHMASDHDRTIFTYFQALKYMPNSHLPYLYIGLEHCAFTHRKIGLDFVLKSSKLCVNDPVVIHELGLIAYQDGEFKIALEYFETALHMVKNIYPDEKFIPPFWEPLYINLGYVFQKLKKYKESINYLIAAQFINPNSSFVYVPLAFSYALDASYDMAIDTLHMILSNDTDDIVCQNLMDFLMKNRCYETDA